MAKVRSAASAFAVSLVVLGLAFVGATALAITFYLQSEKASHDKEIAEANLIKTKVQGDETKPAVVKALAEQADGGNKGSLIGILADQNENLAKKIEKLEKVDLADKQEAINRATAEFEKKKGELARAQVELESIRAISNAKVAAAEAASGQDRDAADKAKQEAQLKIAAADADVKAAQERLSKAIEEQQLALALKDKETAAEAKKAAQLVVENRELTKKIRDAHRPISSDVATPVGKIVNFLSNEEIVLNLGSAERVRPGLTFEVFASNAVVHTDHDAIKIRMEAGNIVSGKATVEVYSVQEHECIARKVRGGPNVHLAKGDVLINLAYHPTGEVNFIVYGAFDLNHTGNPNGAVEDENRVKALISSAGGKVFEFDTNNPQVNLSPDVDYVVLGKEPEQPTEPTGDEATDVTKVDAYKKAMRNYELYVSLANQAKQMQIPVLNQNRFLELIGFYHRNQVGRAK